MGRHAFFNTGVEYKFEFALQDSSDILRFGGWFNNSWDENPIVKWSAWSEEVDGSRILDKLRGLEVKLGLPECNFKAFSADVAGTYALKQSLREQQVSDYKMHALYVLGCIIYHQLQYKPVLEAHFEF